MLVRSLKRISWVREQAPWRWITSQRSSRSVPEFEYWVRVLGWLRRCPLCRGQLCLSRPESSCIFLMKTPTKRAIRHISIKYGGSDIFSRTPSCFHPSLASFNSRLFPAPISLTLYLQSSGTCTTNTTRNRANAKLPSTQRRCMWGGGRRTPRSVLDWRERRVRRKYDLHIGRMLLSWLEGRLQEGDFSYSKLRSFIRLVVYLIICCIASQVLPG